MENRRKGIAVAVAMILIIVAVAVYIGDDIENGNGDTEPPVEPVWNMLMHSMDALRFNLNDTYLEYTNGISSADVRLCVALDNLADGNLVLQCGSIEVSYNLSGIYQKDEISVFDWDEFIPEGEQKIVFVDFEGVDLVQPGDVMVFEMVIFCEYIYRSTGDTQTYEEVVV